MRRRSGEREESSSSGCCLARKDDWALPRHHPVLPTMFSFSPSLLSGDAIASCRKAALVPLFTPTRLFPAVLDAGFFPFLLFIHGLALFFFFFLTRSAVATFPVVSPVPYFFVKLGLSTAVPPACWFRARYVSEVCDRVTCAGYVYVCVCVNCVSRCFQSALFLCLLPRPVMFAVVRSTFFFVRVQLSFELFPPVTSSSPQSCLRRLIVSYLGSLFANVAGCTVLQRCATTTVSLAGGTSDGRKRQCAHCSADQTKGIRPVHLLTLGMLRVGRTLLPAGFATQAPQAHGEKLALASPVRKNVNFPHLYFFFV